MEQKQLIIEMAENLHKKLKLLSVKNNTSMRALIIQAIQELTKAK
jgi:hypothetical protein